MSKYYVVRSGRQTGIFRSWPECQQQVNGFSGAQYKSFLTLQEAENWLQPVKEDSRLQLHRVTITPDSKIFYTDGSCQKGKGGWAYVLVENNQIIQERFKALPDYPTTNNRAELSAFLAVLQDYPDDDLVIHSDSKYSIKCVSVWWMDWKRRGWKKSNGQTPENLDLIQAIIKLHEGRKVNYEHVYAHQGHIFNERCDVLAKDACWHK